jgi:hypothetical protein
MANKRIDELISKAIIDANDLVFVGDPLTGWLYKATVADLQAGVTGGIGGSGTANFIPKFATANTIGNSTIFDNGTSVAIGTTTPNASFKFVVNGNVSFGEYGLNTGFVSFDTTPTNTPTSAGTLSWNDTDGTLDLKLKGGNVTNQIGQEINKRVVNKSGATLNEADFRAVRIRLVSEGGAQGQRLAVVLAQADNDTNSATTIGLVTETIANNAEGFITLIGEVKEIDTTGAKSYGGTETWSDGDILYLSPTHAGYLTNIKPQAPQHTIVIGFVSYAHAIHGKIDIKVDNGYELDELHNVKINTSLHNQALIFNSSDNTWRNRTIIKTDGYVPYFDQSSLFLDSPLYTNGTKVAIGTNSFIGTNLLSVQGGIYSEEHTINGNLLIHSNTLSGNAFISRWSGTIWDVEQTFYSDHILFSKDIESTKFTKTGGTSAQFLMADGSTATTSSLSLLTGPGTQNYIAKFYDASGLMMYNSQLYDNGTNVGIGTTSPFKKFTVQGGAISVYSSSTNYGFMDTSNNSFSFTSANGFYFVANNIGTVASTYVDTTGKWGFGVGTPSYKVDVNGDVNTNGIYRISGSPLSTTNIAEGTNLYFTSNRVLGQVLTGLNSSLSGTMLATDSLIEGLSKVQYQLNNKEGLITAGTTAQYWRGDKTWQTLNTSVVPEETNLYYTDARSRSAISSSATGLTYTSGTGVFSLTAGYAIPTTSALGNYDTAYNRSLTAVAVSGTTTKTITLTKQDGTTLTASWSDYDTAPVTSVFGRTGAIVATSGDYTTAQVTESGNLYYTDARARASVSAGTGISYNSTTGIISYSGTVYTDSSIRALFSAGTGISYNNTTGVIASTITQYTDAMARASLSFTAGSGAYNSTTGVITIPTNTSQLTNGANFITLASLSASSPLSYNSGTGAFSILQATTTTNGYLSSTDWNTFNNKQNALGYTPVPTTRTLTINGTAYDLSADRSWTVAGTISGLTSGYIPKATSASTLGNSLIYDNGTNVGIGTISPNSSLDVVSNTNANAISIRARSTNDYGVLDFRSNNGSETISEIYIHRTSANIGNLIFSTNNGGTATERMRLTSAGNLGLGTTSPESLTNQISLSIKGTSYARLDLYDSTNKNMYLYGGSGYAVVGATSSATNGLQFEVNGATRATISSSGNLGLGVTPSAWTSWKTLQISGGAVVAGYSNNTILGNNWYYDGTDRYLASTNASIYQQAGGVHYWYNAPSGTAGTAISFTQAMTLDASGRLGIGTTSPSGRLDVQASGLSTFSYYFKNSNGGYGGGIYNTSGVNTQLYLATSAGTENVLLNSSGSSWLNGGNVGIGTTSPSRQLDINGNLRVQSGTIDFSNDFNNQIWSLSNNLNFKTNGSEKMIITSGGNVGIATTSPSAQFHVASGNVVIGGNPTTQYKFNVQGVSGKYLSFWTPTISSANNNGIMSHDGNGLSGLTPFGHYGSFHVFNGEVTGGGMVQVAGDVNISGTFKVNGTPIGTGGGGVSGSGSTNYLAMWSSATSLTNAPMYFSLSTIYMQNNIYAMTSANYFGTSSQANKLLIARPSDGNFSATYVGFHDANNTNFGIANNSGNGEVQIYANSYAAMKVRWNTIELPNLASGSTGRALMELYYDANGFVKIKL